MVGFYENGKTQQDICVSLPQGVTYNCYKELYDDGTYGKNLTGYYITSNYKNFKEDSITCKL